MEDCSGQTSGKRCGDDISPHRYVKRRRSSSFTSNSSVDSTSNSGSIEVFDLPVSTPLTPATPTSPIPRNFSRTKSYTCHYDSCNKTFNRPARLQEHIRSHTNERPFQCPHDDCEKSFLRQSHLNHHVKSAHTNLREHICEWQHCGKRFLTATRLRRHRQAHLKAEEFRCVGFPPCSDTFRKHSTLKEHIDKVHLHRKPYSCQQVDGATGEKCTQGFDTRARLRSHEERCHGEARFSCELCPATLPNDVGQPLLVISGPFATYADLQSHIAEAHPPRCKHCNVICSTPRELQKHIDINHSDTTLDERKKHHCTIPGCGKGFTKGGNLNIHVRTVHSDDRRFICGVTDLSSSRGLESWNGKDACSKAFGAKATLESHVLTQHLGQASSRAQTRKQKQGENRKVKKTVTPLMSTVARLTGAGYSEESGRDIACFVQYCEHRFLRQYDLEVHAKVKHAMTEQQVAEAAAERQALQGGQFWFGGLDEEEDEDEQPELDSRGNPFWSYDAPDFEINIRTNNFEDMVDPTLTSMRDTASSF